MAASVVVEPLIPGSAPRFFAFFDGEAFSDNPEWAGCYCHFCYADHTSCDWDSRPAAENKAASARLIAAGRMQGYLARAGDETVGWCSAGPASLFPAENIGGPHADVDKVGQILCFVVAPKWRRQGVARALLAAACDGLKAQGLAFARANPRPEASGEKANHFGPMALYLEAGFEHYADDPDGSVHLRKAL